MPGTVSHNDDSSNDRKYYGREEDLATFINREKLSGEQFVIDTGSEVSTIEPSFKEFLKLDLDHQA